MRVAAPKDNQPMEKPPDAKKKPDDLPETPENGGGDHAEGTRRCHCDCKSLWSSHKKLMIIAIIILSIILLAAVGLTVYFVVEGGSGIGGDGGEGRLFGDDGDWEEYQKFGLEEHNKLRAKHQGTGSLKLNARMNRLAVECAQHYLSKNTIDHSCSKKVDENGQTYGENLGMHMNPSGEKRPKKVLAGKTINSWYDEIKDWDFATASRKGGVTGHFTQLVWVESKELGFGMADNGKNTFIVALYNPAGNMMGDEKQNVKPLK